MVSVLQALFVYSQAMGPLEIVGLAILSGFLVTQLLARTRLPAVTSYVFIGILMGPSMGHIISSGFLTHSQILVDVVLSIIAFIIGGELRIKQLLHMGKSVIAIVFFEAMGTWVLVFLGLQAVFHNLPVSLVLASIATATAPVSTALIMRDLHAFGSMTKTILAAVAVDNVIALLLYAISSVLAKGLVGDALQGSFTAFWTSAGLQIGGSILIGGMTGVVLSPIIRKYSGVENNYILELAVLFSLSGIMLHMGMSPFLANMAFGMVITNLCPFSSNKIFSQIQKTVPPLLIVFYIIAGAHVNLHLFPDIWWLCLLFVLLRVLGKISFATVGAIVGGAEFKIQRYVGFGLVSQMSIALALGLIALNDFQKLGTIGQGIANVVINVTLITTILTEIISPFLMQFALVRAGETHAN